MGHKYRSKDSLAELISQDSRLLQVMSRFGIALGFGDKTVAEVCNDNQVDTDTFLSVCNYISQGIRPSFDEFSTLKADALLLYLRNSHNFFLNFKLPNIRRKFVNAVDCSTHNEVGYLILKFFDDYVSEIQKHQEYETEHFFAYVEGLIQGKRNANMSLQHFEDDQEHKKHDEYIAQRMTDLKNIIIRYSPSSISRDLLNDALLHLFEFENDYESHTLVEDTIFFPVVSVLESIVDVEEDSESDTTEVKETLSEREKDIILGVVRGKTNKEIADALFISIHTVLTHRRNIARKLEIHSPAGLVIYALVNGLVSIDEIREISYN